MINSATLLGSSSGRNSGDAALMHAIATCVDKACGRPLSYEIPTIKPSYIRDNYPSNVHPVATLPWNFSIKMLGYPTYRSIMNTDLTLVFDAILFDRALFNPLFNYMSTLSLFFPPAKRRGKRMGFYNVGAGPVGTPRGRAMLRDLADMMDFVSVRDQDSYDILKEIGVQNPHMFIAADAALNAPASPDDRARAILEKAGLDLNRDILAININEYIDTWAQPGRPSMGTEKFLATYAVAINRVMKDIDAQLLFVTTQHADVDITRNLMARVKSPSRLIANVNYNHSDMKSVLRNVSLLFAMRLHAMILASSEMTPIIGLAYQPKIHHYFNVLGVRRLSLGFEEFSEETLVRHIIGGWAAREEIRRHLQHCIPALQRKALRPAEFIAALDRGEDADKAFARIVSTEA